MKGRLGDAAKGKSNRPPWLREKELMAVSSWLILRPSRKQMANGLHLHDHQQHQQSMRASTSLRCFPNGSTSGGSTKLSAKTKSMFRLLLRWSLIRLVLRLVAHVTPLCPERISLAAASLSLCSRCQTHTAVRYGEESAARRQQRRRPKRVKLTRAETGAPK